MIDITLNGERKSLPQMLTVADLVRQLGYQPRRVAVEVNQEVVPSIRHAEHQLQPGDAVEIVTLVGGGSQESGVRGQAAGIAGQESGVRSQESDQRPLTPEDKPLIIGKFRFQSRLITGTGKYANYDLMRDCLTASGCEVTTVAVRRER